MFIDPHNPTVSDIEYLYHSCLTGKQEGSN